MANSAYNDILKTSLGFDRMFRSMNTGSHNQVAFPPHNIEVQGVDPSDPDGYTIELAIAGFRRDEVSIRVAKSDGVKTLEVRGSRNTSREDKVQKAYIVQNIAYRDFVRRWAIADSVEVAGAKMEDGILSIDLQVVKQEAKPNEVIINIG